MAAEIAAIAAAVGVSMANNRYFEIKDGVRSIKLKVDKHDFIWLQKALRNSKVGE